MRWHSVLADCVLPNKAVHRTQLIVSRLAVPFVRCCNSPWLPAYVSGDNCPLVKHACCFTHSLTELQDDQKVMCMFTRVLLLALIQAFTGIH